MSEYLLLLHEPQEGFSETSPQQMQAIIEKYHAWAQGLAEQGRIVESRKLKDDGGRKVQRSGTDVVMDGPFSETKEVIGGFFLIKADSYDEALEVCRDCPHLEYGVIELREIDRV